MSPKPQLSPPAPFPKAVDLNRHVEPDERHALLQSQWGEACAGGRFDLDHFIELVSDAYREQDRIRRRTERANRLMSEEIEAQTDALHDALRSVGLQNIRFQAALDNMPQGLCLFDPDGCLVVYNRTFRQIYALDEAFDPVGCRLNEILKESRRFKIANTLEGSTLILEHVALRVNTPPIEQSWPNGQTVRITRSLVHDGGFLDMIDDITEKRQALERVVHMAHFDALTDLPNRQLFRERLSEAVQGSARTPSAILTLDLDRFKAVNDTLGHPVGDALLIEVSQRLKGLLRDGDLSARLSGDEFGVLLKSYNRAADVHRLAARIVSRLSVPYRIRGHDLVVGVSVGIDFVDSPDVSADERLRNADLALNRAKRDGGGVVCVFAPEQRSELDSRRSLELDLRAALVRDEFMVYYQPQFCIKKAEICGFEALVRWKSPTRGIVSPGEFIGLSEEIGLIDELGIWVLRRACRDAAAMPAHLSMAVNLSPVQFRSKRLVANVQAILKETGLLANRLELEVTESVMISDTQGVLQTLRELKAMGVRISLDDFGTGYSSLSYLRNFPFDKIKIDQSFVRDLGKSDDSLAIIRAVSGICSSLGITSIAEGVETQAQYDILRDEKCDSLQGYLFGRPKPLEEIACLLSTAHH